MIITKAEAKEYGIEYNQICKFHENNPDQEGIRNSCNDCMIIEDPCGCDMFEGCEECDPESFRKGAIDLYKRRMGWAYIHLSIATCGVLFAFIGAILRIPVSISITVCKFAVIALASTVSISIYDLISKKYGAKNNDG